MKLLRLNWHICQIKCVLTPTLTAFTGPSLSSYKDSYADPFGPSCDSGNNSSLTK